MGVLRFLADPRNAETVAFAATLLCLYASAQVAVMLRRKVPRVFTAAVLFTLNWAVLLLYYLPGPPQDEILSSFSGILLIYVGVLLMREAAGKEPDRPVGWPDTLPLHLFRATVAGYGVYLVAKRLFGWEYGYGTLALALWGTLLTILGYVAVWAGLVFLRHGPAGARWLGPALAAVLAVYCGCEVAYAVWYDRDLWPVYHRYLVLQSSPGAPHFDTPLPLQPQPDWPDYAAWARLAQRPEWREWRRVTALAVQPRLPEPWNWLRYALSLLKVTFTAFFLGAVWAHRAGPRRRPSRGLWAWLDRQIRPEASLHAPGPGRDRPPEHE